MDQGSLAPAMEMRAIGNEAMRKAGARHIQNLDYVKLEPWAIKIANKIYHANEEQAISKDVSIRVRNCEYTGKEQTQTLKIADTYMKR